MSHQRFLTAVGHQTGVSLVELMISMTLGLLLVGGMLTIFVNNSTTRSEVERMSQQVDNGSYAMQVLSDDIRAAGYWAELDVANAGFVLPTVKPDPCSTDLTLFPSQFYLPIQGYDDSATLSCLTDLKSGTDILVIRRVSTCVGGQPNCALQTGVPYFQAASCSTELSLASTNWYRLDTNTSNLNRHKKDCLTAADQRQYFNRIYFIANNDQPGDGIPTLKRVDWTGGNNSPYSIVSVAEGIQNLQFEYGIDYSGSGFPGAFSSNPDTYAAPSGPTCPVACLQNWMNVVSVKINLLAQNTSTSMGYVDKQIYTLGLQADQATPNTVGPFNDAYRRHVFAAEVAVSNVSERRQDQSN